MYHHVADAAPGANAVERDLSVSPARFAEQLAWLRQAGYETITLTELAAHFSEGRSLPAKPIILTFDDGYADNYEQAFPLLKAQGYRGAFFILTDFVDEGRAGYMNWPQIEEMERAGMEIGSHGRNHIDLRRKSWDYLVWQLLGSKQTLEAHVERPVQTFCYPSGKYDSHVASVLRSAGYVVAVTVDQGSRHSEQDLLQLKRLRVRGGDALTRFILKVDG